VADTALLPIDIRDERRADIDGVDALVAAAFDGRPNEVALVRALRRAPAPAISRVAWCGEVLAGHALLSALRLSGSAASVLGLAPVSVSPSWQGVGVGAALVTDAVERAAVFGAELVVVLGDPAYYRRFGFVRADRHRVGAPVGVRADALQVIPLVGWTDPDGGPPPVVVYPDVFVETGTL